jgi:predicted RNase H-like HicB family nuclease
MSDARYPAVGCSVAAFIGSGPKSWAIVLISPWIHQLVETSIASRSDRGSFTALVKRDGRWWIGWIEEIPGVSSQGRTRDELIENLHSALSDAIAMNRASAVAEVAGEFVEVSINL